MNFSPPSFNLPADLDLWLRTSEREVPKLRVGTEKKIQWVTPGQSTPLALGYLHGFSASRQELSPVLETVGHRVGANVFFSRMKGHGLDGSALASADAESWLADGFEAVAVTHRLGKKIVLVGMSAGATVAAWVAANTNNRSGLILISPNFGLKGASPKILLFPWGIQMAKRIVGPERSWEPKNDLQARIWTTRYPLESLRAVLSLCGSVGQDELGHIKVPTLVLFTPNDERVDTSLIIKAFDQLGTDRKKLFRVEGAKEHVLAGDAVSPGTNAAVIDEISDFLKRL